jgi:hypothetical protein
MMSWTDQSWTLPLRRRISYTAEGLMTARRPALHLRNARQLLRERKNEEVAGSSMTGPIERVKTYIVVLRQNERRPNWGSSTARVPSRRLNGVRLSPCVWVVLYDPERLSTIMRGPCAHVSGALWRRGKTLSAQRHLAHGGPAHGREVLGGRGPPPSAACGPPTVTSPGCLRRFLLAPASPDPVTPSFCAWLSRRPFSCRPRRASPMSYWQPFSRAPGAPCAFALAGRRPDVPFVFLAMGGKQCLVDNSMTPASI